MSIGGRSTAGVDGRALSALFRGKLGLSVDEKVKLLFAFRSTLQGDKFGHGKVVVESLLMFCQLVVTSLRTLAPLKPN